MSELLYDQDIYDLTSAERGAVENVVWDANKYVAYVQWGSGSDTIYAYNCSTDQWSKFVNRVNESLSVGSALRNVGWGGYFNDYSGYTNQFVRRAPEQVKFEVTLNFTGQIVIQVDAATLTEAVIAATAMFKNDATTGTIEVLEAKKVI